ncbi:MAG: hypothetical protein CL943_00520 [Candidatus Diapherotrites archaeon]|uniref:BioF2-like acetyltransferase domain-containing protein n=1 Tax=Candidatus Iainarchaeum sp. TaxID=3101447 RepID=A0A2D6M021_9ARCH|nr:hypothetical protein [Candidatus Diapherotrites archaeon]|tara:strand:+ start:475 stop:1491 length:1017 start_codon:yes stop_codon:yes gene_type:complete
MIEIREATNLEAVKELEGQWRKLEKNLFVSFDWVVSWFECKKDSKPFVLSAWNNNQLVGIAPLALENEILVFAGQQYGNHLDFICEKQEVAKALAKKILNSSWKRVEFKHLVDEPLFLKSLKDGLILKKEQGEGSNVIHLVTMEKYYAGLKKKNRKNNRNVLSKLERAYKIETRLVGKDEFKESWNAFVEMHLGNIAAHKNKTILEQGWFQCFYKNTAQRALAHDKLFLMELLLDGKLTGSLFGVVQGKTLNVMNIGYLAGEEKQSIGTVLFLKAMELCCKKKIGNYDLLSGGKDYKEKLGAQEKSTLELYLFRNKTSEKTFTLKKKVKGFGKKVLGR